MKHLTVKDWGKFQHYKDRNPPWIKLETDTFMKYEFGQLSDASKLLAVCIWTLASRYKDPKLGLVPADLEYIKRQCNLGDLITEEHLKELINQGYIIDASDALADCKQSAIPETETYSKETYKKETEGEAPNDFKNLAFEGEYLKAANDVGLHGELGVNCWNKWKAIRESAPPHNPLGNWKIWAMKEKKPVVKESLTTDRLTGKDLHIQRLGIAAWRRKSKLSLNPDQSRFLESYETKNGAVWWQDVEEYKARKGL